MRWLLAAVDAIATGLTGVPVSGYLAPYLPDRAPDPPRPCRSAFCADCERWQAMSSRWRCAVCGSAAVTVFGRIRPKEESHA